MWNAHDFIHFQKSKGNVQISNGGIGKQEIELNIQAESTNQFSYYLTIYGHLKK